MKTKKEIEGKQEERKNLTLKKLKLQIIEKRKTKTTIILFIKLQNKDLKLRQ